MESHLPFSQPAFLSLERGSVGLQRKSYSEAACHHPQTSSFLLTSEPVSMYFLELLFWAFSFMMGDGWHAYSCWVSLQTLLLALTRTFSVRVVHVFQFYSPGPLCLPPISPIPFSSQRVFLPHVFPLWLRFFPDFFHASQWLPQ